MSNKLVYEYRTEDGRTIEKKYSIGKAPKTVMTDDGKKAYRVFSSSTIIPKHMKAT